MQVSESPLAGCPGCELLRGQTCLSLYPKNSAQNWAIIGLLVHEVSQTLMALVTGGPRENLGQSWVDR